MYELAFAPIPPKMEIPLPLCPLQGESFSFDTESSFDPEVSGPKGRTKCSVNPFPFHVENPARGGGEGVGGEVTIMSTLLIPKDS
jgi:hypothetical protein